jgi:hypothetical protein
LQPLSQLISIVQAQTPSPGNNSGLGSTALLDRALILSN